MQVSEPARDAGRFCGDARSVAQLAQAARRRLRNWPRPLRKSRGRGAGSVAGAATDLRNPSAHNSCNGSRDYMATSQRTALRLCVSLAGCVLVFALSGCKKEPGCGNGVVDKGEACDDGANNGKSGSCCDATCHLLSAGEVCRAAAGTCDKPEVCDGASNVCPPDAIAAAGTRCNGAGAAVTCGGYLLCDGSSPQCPADIVPCRDSTECQRGACVNGACDATVELTDDDTKDCGGGCAANQVCGANNVCQFAVDPNEFQWSDEYEMYVRKCHAGASADDPRFCSCSEERCETRFGVEGCYPACTQNDECGDEALCVSGVCQQPSDGPCPGTPAGASASCTTTSDCESGYACGDDATCQPLLVVVDSVSGSCAAYCQDDNDCPAPQLCVEHACAALPSPVECQSDDDCGVGGTCSGGVCNDPPDATGPVNSLYVTVETGSESDAWGGIVTSDPSGINCGDYDSASCEAGFSGSVTLTATPDPGWVFDHWEGACSGTTATCSVSVAADSNVTAVFAQPPAAPTGGPCRAVLRRLQKDAYRETGGRTSTFWPPHTTTSLEVWCDNVRVGYASMNNHGSAPDDVDVDGNPLLEESCNGQVDGTKDELLQLLANYQKCECATTFLGLDSVKSDLIPELLASVATQMKSGLTCPDAATLDQVVAFVQDRGVVGTDDGIGGMAHFLALVAQCSWTSSSWPDVLQNALQSAFTTDGKPLNGYHVCNNDSDIQTNLFNAFVSGQAVPTCDAHDALCAGPSLFPTLKDCSAKKSNPGCATGPANCGVDRSSGEIEQCCCPEPKGSPDPPMCQITAICPYPIIFGSCCCPDYYLGCPSGECDAWESVGPYCTPPGPNGCD